MAPTTMNHLSDHQDSAHEQPHHDHRQVTDPHMIDCSCNGVSVPRFDDEMKEEVAVVATHPIMFAKGVLTQKLWNHYRPKLELQRLQASQELLDESIYELDGIPWPPQVFDLDSEASAKRMASLCAIASHLCYQNEDVIKDVVKRMWNMQFVEFFECWNNTQAFMFTDKEENANAVVIVFRGTERINVADWSTDLRIAYHQIKGMGRVHRGFLEALGLPRASSDKAAAAAEAVLTANDPKKSFAYDAICSQLRTILLANPEAKVFVTGHSLGGALAALFTALLMHENDGIQSKLKGVFTFGQPRVGDASFAQYMEERLCAENNKARKYFRVVFKNDVVPRVPPDDVLFQFKHISPCVYYKSFYHCEIIEEEPHKNLLSDILQPIPYIAAIEELLERLSHRPTEEELSDRLMEILTPAVCDHSCLRYVEAVKTAPSVFLKQAT